MSTRRPFDIVFSGAGVFPPRGAPRVLWIGIGAGVDRTPTRFSASWRARVAAHGVELDARDFHPHLTLGRWRSSRTSDRARVARGSAAMARSRAST